MTTSLPSKPRTADERLQALARSASNVPLLKFNSGNWTISDIPVPADTRFALYADQVTHSWTHFAGGKVVTEISAVVAEDDEGDPERRIVKGNGRKDLGLNDELTWELDSAGKHRDPWVYSFGLPMMNAETGAIVVFKTASVGGMSAIAGQVANFARNKRMGYPIVRLSNGSYRNKKHGGFTSFPAFVTVAYDTPPAPVIANGGNGGDDARVIGASRVRDRETDDMDDDIPF
jgi:hypothetical protein